MIFFGPGEFENLGEIIKGLGTRALVITGARSFEESGKKEVLFQMLKRAPVTFLVEKVQSEPTCELVDGIINSSRDFNPDFVIAIGGGSVIDTGKAVSCMIEESGSVVDFLEDVGTKQPSGRKKLFIAVPTTAGTGSEATKNAVISGYLKDQGRPFKKSLRHDNYVPDVAVVDPKLTISCPPSISVQAGIDAFIQLLESFVSRGASFFTDSLVRGALFAGRETFYNLKRLEKGDLASRCVMSYAALISGITLTNAGLGAVHGLASAIGGIFSIPHGAICGALLSAVCELNIRRLLEDKKGGFIYVEKYAEAGRILSGQDFETRQEALDALLGWIKELTARLEIPPLGAYGVSREDFENIISNSSSRNNPIEMSEDDFMEILEKSL